MSPAEADLRAVCAAMRGERLVAVAVHENPDSDAVGAAVGMLDLFAQLGIPGRIHVSDKERLPIAEAFIGADLISHEMPSADAALYALNCGSPQRMALPGELQVEPKVNIDHHQDNSRFGQIVLVRPDASSTSEMVCDLAAGLGLTPRPWAANALYAGVSFDSGHFRHANTSAHTFECAGALVRAGADPQRIYQLLYETRTLPTLRLWGRAVANVVALNGGKALVSVLAESDYNVSGTDDTESEGIVEFLRSTAGVEVAALVKQIGFSGRTRVSLRSESFDVAAIAALRGGGGHKQAAGFSVDGTPKEVAEWLATELARRLETESF